MSNRNRPKPFASNAAAPPAGGVSVNDARRVESLPVVETCGGCRFWKRGETSDTLGCCTARPPSVVTVATGLGPLCSYPVVMIDEDACGLAEAK